MHAHALMLDNWHNMLEKRGGWLVYREAAVTAGPTSPRHKPHAGGGRIFEWTAGKDRRAKGHNFLDLVQSASKRRVQVRLTTRLIGHRVGGG